ncbi:MAG TPA: rhodanese-like domain-containing protein [Bryobacteraceae bacterium]|nr:rhodanese-like domain-containing protein [Bryobacteraceae bacterium]
MLKLISPEEARTSGLEAVDVREFPEFAAGAIRGSRIVPLATLSEKAASWDRKEPLLLVCRSGRRAMQGAETLERLGFQDLQVLDGGIDAWSKAGLPLQTLTKRPWSLERQVRVIAGALVFVFTVLGLTVSQWFNAATIFVGSGLVFAGVSDVCLMATVLGKAPWNRVDAANFDATKC